MNAQTPIPIPPGREAIAAAIETLIAVLDAMTPDADLETAGDELDQAWCEGIAQRSQHEGDLREDAEEDDWSGGAVDDEPHDEEMDAGYLAREARTTGRSWALDQRFIVTAPGPYSDSLPLKHSRAWEEAERPLRIKRGGRIRINGRGYRGPSRANPAIEGK